MISKPDNRRKNAAKKKKTPTPKPWWAEAFMILLLHKTGGEATLNLESLENFEKVKSAARPVIEWDSERKLVVLKSPQYEKPRIVTPRIAIPN